MTDTKQITFEGRSYTVPVWVDLVGRNADGAIYGFYSNPSCSSYQFNPVDNRGAHFISAPQIYWRDSLTKV